MKFDYGTLRKCLIAAGSLGPGWLARRSQVEVRKRLLKVSRRPNSVVELTDDQALTIASSSQLDALPIAAVLARQQSSAKSLLPSFSPEEFARRTNRLEALETGKFIVFSDRQQDYGDPPNWHLNCLTGTFDELEAHRHWATISTSKPGEDIKGVWEASRWSWVSDLILAAVAGCDFDRCAASFWRLIRCWHEANPYGIGPNWVCGQEAAFRLFMLALGTAAFQSSALTTTDDQRLSSRLAFELVSRIREMIEYGVSQDNNHGISEAVGLYAAGSLWPALDPDGEMRRQGLRLLNQQVVRLIYDDGGFSQHSTNYARLVLEVLCFHSIACRAAKVQVDQVVARGAHRCANFLSALLETSGCVHRYGLDDGARLFALSKQDYEDFRPALATAAVEFGSTGVEDGPWCEQAMLLSGKCQNETDSVADRRAVASKTGISYFPDAGVATFRTQSQSLLFRVPIRFRHRPSKADQLHVDLHADGEPVTEQPGTYSYNASGPLGDGMGSVRFHNSVQIDDTEFMERLGRFLWIPWVPVKILQHDDTQLAAMHVGYRGVQVTRAVVRIGESLIVVDRIVANRVVGAALRWHSKSTTALQRLRVLSNVDLETKCYNGDASSGLGYFSRRYGRAEEGHCLEARASCRVGFFITAMDVPIEIHRDVVQVGERRISLVSQQNRSPVRLM